MKKVKLDLKKKPFLSGELIAFFLFCLIFPILVFNLKLPPKEKIEIAQASMALKPPSSLEATKGDYGASRGNRGQQGDCHSCESRNLKITEQCWEQIIEINPRSRIRSASLSVRDDNSPKPAPLKTASGPVLISSKLYYHFSDHLGSSSFVMDASNGKIIQESDYYAYGLKRHYNNRENDL